MANGLQRRKQFRTIEHIGGQQSGGTGKGAGHTRLTEEVRKHCAEGCGQRNDEGLVGEQSGHGGSDSVGDAGGRGVPRQCGRHLRAHLGADPFAHRLRAGQARDHTEQGVTECIDHTGVGEQRVHHIGDCRDDTVAEVVATQQARQRGLQCGHEFRSAEQCDDDLAGDPTECGRHSGLAEEVGQHRAHDVGESAGEAVVRQQAGHHVAGDTGHGVAERPAAESVGHQPGDLVTDQRIDGL